jgi:hypothetical protein
MGSQSIYWQLIFEAGISALKRLEGKAAQAFAVPPKFPLAHPGSDGSLADHENPVRHCRHALRLPAGCRCQKPVSGRVHP